MGGKQLSGDNTIGREGMLLIDNQTPHFCGVCMRLQNNMASQSTTSILHNSIAIQVMQAQP
jgi:hypothetical protein